MTYKQATGWGLAAILIAIGTAFGIQTFGTQSFGATTVTPVFGGGTGQSSFTSSQLLYGNGTNALSSVATTTASCAGTASCSAFTIIGSSPATITGTGGSGTVTSVGLTDANSTLTIGNTPITTSGNITATFNLAHSNWWTALQNFTNASSSQFTATSSTYLASTAGSVAVGATTTPAFLFSLNAPASTNLFGIGSSTQTIIHIGQDMAWMHDANVGYSIASSSAAAASYTVNWSQGATQRFFVNQATVIIINSTSSNPANGGRYILDLVQGGPGGAVTWATPGVLRWGGTGNATTSCPTTVGTQCILNILYDSNSGVYTVVASSTGATYR